MAELEAYQAQEATAADLMCYWVGAEKQSTEIRASQHAIATTKTKANARTTFSDLSQLTRRRLIERYAAHPFLQQIL